MNAAATSQAGKAEPDLHAVASWGRGPYPEPLALLTEEIAVPSWTEGGEWGEAGMPARMEGVDPQREETRVLTWKDVIGSEK